MSEHAIHLFPTGALVALVGNPNCGKTAIFNALTGSRQKVANYAGVTVERKEGRFTTPHGKTLRILDLPGTYGLYPRSPDERVTCDVLAGRAQGEKKPDYVICVVNATNLRRGLRLVLAVQRLGIPMMVALNMMDVAKSRGMNISAEKLSAHLGVPVVETVGVKSGGVSALAQSLVDTEQFQVGEFAQPKYADEACDDQAIIRGILRELDLEQAQPTTLSDKIDQWVLHPVVGSLILMSLLFVIFQAVFAWSELPMSLIESVTSAVGEWLGALLPEGILRSFVVDGLIAGVGGVLVFLPQIIVLFFFILLLEETGYLPRAALLLDRVMGTVGLSGRSFIPLLSSFACAIPGIMATRTIANPRDRLVTILIAPLMTCSARLPVYALLIGAFIPAQPLGFGVNTQGVALFVLYFAGIVAVFLVAWVLRWFGSQQHRRTLMLELPDYHAPSWKNLALGLWQRVEIFLRRVGGIILTLTVLMWFLASFPSPPAGATGAPIEYSFAGILGGWLNVLFAPIGFNWQISIALVPGMAAREVLVSALGTVYSIAGDDTGGALMPIIAAQWSKATAYSLLAWFVFAPQCLSTIAAIKRETGGWKMPLITLGYLFALAYLASFITYRVALWWA
ncbi:MAG: feoB [Burkholderiaceae bacterium]|nr:feoB [Burkholderiaceae bacterium]